jgi:hypothetical protein
MLYSIVIKPTHTHTHTRQSMSYELEQTKVSINPLYINGSYVYHLLLLS